MVPNETQTEAAFRRYLARFADRYGDKGPGAYVKFGKHMVQRLDREHFVKRLDQFIEMHEACGDMIGGRSTISDAIVLEFDEAAAWICLETPDMIHLFDGELPSLQEMIDRGPGSR